MPSATDGDSRRQARALDVLARSIEVPRSERDRFFDAECGGDGALREEVASLAREADDGLDVEGAFAAADAQGMGPTGVARRVADEAFGERDGLGQRWPARIGRYRVLGPIGEGGMGVVLEAEQDESRRRVAIKVLSHLAASPRARRRFEREADVMAHLEHPAIARVLEAGRFETDLGSQPFLAMELVDGVPLTTYAREQALSIRARVELMAAVAQAVEHAHAHGVVHRDLKPANILVTPAGRPKVLDFGVARAQDVGGELTEPMTRTGQIVGTLAYMSPEQLAGGAVDARSDVHALGVLLHELLVGRLPHAIEGLPFVEAARVLRDEDPPRPSLAVPELRGDLEAIVLTALAKDRERRYPSAAALEADLRAWLDGEPVRARKERWSERAARLARRNAGLAAAIGAVFAALLIGLVGVAWQAARATRLAHEERRRAYVADIHAAAAAFDTLDPERARRHLDSAPAAFRDWEWRYLAARLDAAESVRRVEGALRAVAVSPDGRRLVALATSDEGEGGRAWSWDAATGEGVAPPVATSGAFRDVAFDASGRAVAVAGEEAALSIVDLGTGAVLRRLDLAERGLFHGGTDLAVIASEGALVAASVQPLGRSAVTSVLTWDPATGDVRTHLSFDHSTTEGTGPTALALSPSASVMVVGTYVGEVHVVRLDGPPTIEDISGLGQQPIRSLAFAADGRHLLVGAQDNAAALVDLSSHEVSRPLEGHRGPVASVAFSADSTLAITASEDRVVRTWDARTGRLADALIGHEAAVTCASASPDGTWLVSGDAAGAVRTWRLPSASRARVLAGHESFVYPVAWSPDGRRLWSGSWDGTVREWDPAAGSAVGAPLLAGVPVISLAVSPDASLLAVGVAGPEALLFDARSGRQVAALGPHERRTAGLAFAPDGRLLATASWDNRVRLWDVGTRRIAREVEGLDETFEQSVPIAYAPDGETLAIPWGAADVRLLDVPSLRVRAALVGHGEHVNAIAFSPDGRLVATGSDDATARTWDASTGRPVAVLSGHAAKVHAVGFSRDGARLATGSKDGTVRLWDPRAGDDLLVLEGHRDYVYSLAFSPSGDTIATGSGDGTVRLWETEASATRAR